MATPGGAGSVAEYVTEPLVDPEVDHAWTSDRELDRLAPLTESLLYWSGVYERWRHHELAGARPDQAALHRAELAAVQELRGVHFGQLAAASRRLRQVSAAAARLAESTGVARAALVQGWQDAASQPMVQRFDELARAAQDCAARCAGHGLELEIALIGTVAPVITSAVDEILARSRGLAHVAGRPAREIWEQRIAELSGGTPEDHPVWRAELDTLIIEYDAVVGLLRATLAAAGTAVRGIYRTVAHEIASFGAASHLCDASFRPPGPLAGSRFDHPERAGLGTEPAPASTRLASVGAGEPSAGSSFTGSGGGSAELLAAAGSLDQGSAVLGSLGESRAADPGGATLGSLSGADAESGGSQAWGHSAPAPLAGAVGAAGSDEPHRTARHWAAGPGNFDEQRDASWARLRALLGEESEEGEEHPELGGPDS